MRITRTTWITAAVLLVAVLTAVALKNGARAEAPARTVETKVAVRVVELRRRGLAGEVRVGGFLRARDDITISAERAGRVVALPAIEGRPVDARHEVARLDDTVAAANLAQARAAAREAGLNPNLPAAALASARAALQRAEHEYRLHHPASPIKGVVEKHHVDVGEYVVPGTPLVDVIDATTLILDVDVDAEIVALLDRGEVTVEGGPATVARVAGRADRNTRRFRVELEVPPGALRPGMYAEARFRIPAGDPAFYLPKATIRPRHGESGVFLVREGRVVWIPLTLAPVHHEPSLWRVVDGALLDGDALVTGGFSGLREGAPVGVER